LEYSWNILESFLRRDPPALGADMIFSKEFSSLRRQFGPLTLYGRFEHLCMLVLTFLICIVIIFSIWHLALNIFFAIIERSFDPTDVEVFQAVFGMVFTVIIALEFKRSLFVLAERHNSIVQVRSVLLIGLLAVVRKLIILDISHTEAMTLLALAVAVIALGGAYWLVRDTGRIAATLPSS
jgi:uncharacterized membrane protein (DUF373 family)